jgi:hypothetical protein
MKKLIVITALFISASVSKAQDFSLGVFQLGQNISVLENLGPITKIQSAQDFAKNVYSYLDKPILEWTSVDPKPGIRSFQISEYKINQFVSINNLMLFYRNDSLVTITCDYDYDLRSLMNSVLGQPKIEVKDLACKMPKELTGKEMKVKIMSSEINWQKGNVHASYRVLKLTDYDEEIKIFSISYPNSPNDFNKKCNCIEN